MIIATVATNINNYVQEYIDQLKKLGYNYAILGKGQPWEGFITKMNLYLEFLKNVPHDEIVIICDSYDLLFLQTPQKIMEKYKRLAQNRVVIGLENITNYFCKFSTICDPQIVQKCKINNPYYPDYIYPNSGFIMGRATDLLEIFNFMVQSEFKDDQYGLFQWILGNCHKCYFDVHLDFIFNYIPSSLSYYNHHHIQVTTKDKQVYVKYKNNISQPGAIHMWGHYLDLGKRSEYIRNALFPKRIKRTKIEYFKEFYGKICKAEFNYFGYWWWILLILFIIFLFVFIPRNH